MAATRSSTQHGQLWCYLAEVVSAGSGNGLVEQIQADGASELLLREQIWSRRLGHRGPPKHSDTSRLTAGNITDHQSVQSGNQSSVHVLIGNILTTAHGVGSLS